MDTRKRTFGWGDAIAVFIMSLVLLSVIYPILAKQDNRTHGVVIDENTRPIPGAVLEIRDTEGHFLNTATTDANGEVLWNRAWKLQGTTFGKYGVTRFAHATGGRDHIYLAALVLHRVRVRNAVTGLPQAGLDVRVYPDGGKPFSTVDFRETAVETSPTGEAVIDTFPLTARMRFYCEDNSLAVWNVVSTVVRHKEAPYQKDVLYDVTVVPTGTLTGRAVFPDGTPVTRGVVFATLIGSAPDGENRYERAAIDPATNTFQMRGLLPGHWRVGYEPWYGARDKSQGGREVLIQSGETKPLIEPLRVYWTDDTRKR